MKTIRNFIPTYWSNQMLYRLREENKAIEKINKANLTEEQKINAILLIYNGLYKSAYIYIRGCQEFTRTGKCGTHTIADIAEDFACPVAFNLNSLKGAVTVRPTAPLSGQAINKWPGSVLLSCNELLLIMT